MQMISLVFFLFVAILFFLLWILQKTVKNGSLANRVSKWILLFASYLFVVYADWRFAAVLALLTLSNLALRKV